MTIEIRLVTAAHEIHAIRRQRYAIYVEEVGYHQAYACATTRTVTEPLDDAGVLFGAFQHDRLVGSVRVNYGQCSSNSGDDGFDEYTSLYSLKRFGHWFPDDISIVTKLMIAPRYRAGSIFARLGVTLYTYTRDVRPSTMFCVIDCVPPLRTYFERLGYRQIGPWFKHPAANFVVPMAFPVYDLEHFRSVRSPLARVCPRHDQVSAEWFRKTMVSNQDTSSAVAGAARE